MTERIYDALRGILFVQFPQNSLGQALVYDRPIKNWYLGTRNVVPNDLSIVIHGNTVNEEDYSFGYRKVTYSFDIVFYCMADDVESVTRYSTEGSRIIRNILTQHKRIWVMDVCPICNKLPTNPVHFFSDSTHTAIFGSYGDLTGPYGPAGVAYSNFLTNWQETHYSLTNPGSIATINLISGGLGYATPPSISFLSGGSGSSGASAYTVLTGSTVASINITNVGTQYTANPQIVFSGSCTTGAIATAVISAPSQAGMAAAAFQYVLSNIQSTGTFPAGADINMQTRFNAILASNVNPIRIVYDVQLKSFTPTTEAQAPQLLSKSTFNISMSEIVPVYAFGPNFSGSTSSYNPYKAYDLHGGTN